MGNTGSSEHERNGCPTSTEITNENRESLVLPQSEVSVGTTETQTGQNEEDIGKSAKNINIDCPQPNVDGLSSNGGNLHGNCRENPDNDYAKESNVSEGRSRKISTTIKDTILKSSPVRSIRKRTSTIISVTPHNLDIVEYCKSVINISFHGQSTIKAHMDVHSLMDDLTSNSLPVFLQSLDSFLRSFGSNHITGEEEEFKYYIQGLMEHRNNREYMEKFWKDAERFVEIYNKRGGRF